MRCCSCDLKGRRPCRPGAERLGGGWATGRTREVRVVDWAELLAVLLRLVEPRSSPPPQAADCNSTGLVALTAGGDPLKPKANSAIQRIAVLGESDAIAARGGRAEDECYQIRSSSCDPLGRSGRPPLPREVRNPPLARRELLSSWAPAAYFRVEAAIKTPCGCVYSERQRN